MGDAAEEDGPDDEHEAEEEHPLKVGRRLIYLHRLVGDNVTEPKQHTTRPNPWRVTFFFLLYAMCATITNLLFCDVAGLSEMNVSMTKAMKESQWGYTGHEHQLFDHISKAPDIVDYIRFAVLPEMMASGHASEPNSLLSFNKVMSQDGFCPNVSVIMMTMRKVSTTADYEKTTTSRFNVLYPQTWKGSISAGDEAGEAEATEPMWRNYQYPQSSLLHNNEPSIKVPEAHLGWSDINATKKLTYHKLRAARDRNVWVKWEYAAPCKEPPCKLKHGKAGAGGYVAAIAIRPENKTSQLLLDHQRKTGKIDWAKFSEAAKDQFVFLLSDTGTETTEVGETCGTAGGMKTTNVMRFEDFRAAGFFDSTTSSVSMDFMVYNANKQTVSSVAVDWNIHSAGMVQYPNAIHVLTIKLDLGDSYQPIWEYFYMAGTVFYFFELFVYKCYKDRAKLFRDIWTYVNAVSIVCSCGSLSLRAMYAGNTATALEASKEGATGEVSKNTLLLDAMSMATLYQITSAVALMTIWLRVVELLAQTPPRVKLLNATLIKALTSMMIYFGYIFVIIVGFWSFASVHFCSYTLEFISPFKAFISIFSLFCLNTAPYASTFHAPLRQVFFIPFMMFSIVSVQMFNSIINFAYNKVSEDMEPLFKQAAMERKHKDKHQRSNILVLFFGYIKKGCIRCQRMVLKGKKYKTNDDVKGASDSEAKPSDIIMEDDLNAADKEKAEEFMEALQKKRSGETACSFILYMVFAASYISFLWMSLDVHRNGLLVKSVTYALNNVKVDHTHATLAQSSFGLHDILTIDDLARWLTVGLPQFAFRQDVDGGSPCIHNWNCFASGSDSNMGAGTKFMRISQRLVKRSTNQGVIALEPDPGALPESRFHGGFSQIPIRGPHDPLDRWSAAGQSTEDTTTEMTLTKDGEVYCKRDQEGGFHHTGGIVCLLDADRHNLSVQLENMASSGFYSKASGTITVDTVLINGNSNNVVYVLLGFTLMPSGMVVVEERVSSFSLLPMEEELPEAGVRDKLLNWGANLVKVEYLAGEIYALLTIQFIWRMTMELRQEAHRKYLNDGKQFHVAAMEFFRDDFFQLIDICSYGFSIASVMFFSLWLNQQMQMKSKVDGDFSEFLTYASSIQANSKNYAVISAANLLLIFVRPLKYLRNDPRMSRINQTFYGALEDIMWFFFMLIFFFIGFVLFAHLVFGIQLKMYSTLLHSGVACFGFLLGQFDFWALYDVQSYLAVGFVFVYLFLFKFFFLNVFFAIIDRNFLTGDPPPYNWKRTFRQMSRLVRWVEWDEDYTMNVNDKVEKERPLSRAGRVHQFALTIQRLQHDDYDGGGGADGGGDNDGGKCKVLSDVCDVDEKMNEVLRWSRDEAKRFVQKYLKKQVEKAETSGSETAYLKSLKAEIEKELKKEEELTGEAERHQRYAIYVNENMGKTDQDTLCRYILRLEDKITQKMKEEHALLTDVYHLRAESEKMRYSDEDMKRISDEEQMQHDKLQELQDAHNDDDEVSDGEYAQAPELTDRSGPSNVNVTI